MTKSSIVDRWKCIYRAWRYRLWLEPWSVRFLRDHLRPGDVAIDIGAHKGAITHWMRECVGSTGTVYAFEPQPLLAERLQQMALAYPGGSVVVEERCLSSKEGQALLHVPGGNASPSATLEPPLQRTAMDDNYMVSVTTLDDYFRLRCPKQVTLIKCDVEGHELEVFRGGADLISVHRPHLLFECEVRHRSSGSVDEVFSYLADLGYEGFGLSSDGPFPVDEFDAARHQADPESKSYVNNFAFSHKSRSQSDRLGTSARFLRDASKDKNRFAA